MLELFPKLNEYEKTFGESFPTYNFMHFSPEEIGKIVDECLEKEKDVYALGYIEEDPDVKY